MNSDPQKTEADGGTQINAGTELTDAALNNVAGGSIGSAAAQIAAGVVDRMKETGDGAVSDGAVNVELYHDLGAHGKVLP